MAKLGSLVGGPRGKWVTAAIWLLTVMVTAGVLAVPDKFRDAEKNESTSFLPGDSESVKALEKTERLQDGEQAPSTSCPGCARRPIARAASGRSWAAPPRSSSTSARPPHATRR